MTSLPQIRLARFPQDREMVRGLFREYAESLDFDLGYQGFEQELAGLPGRYAEPQGCVLLAQAGPTPIGCVALRPIEGHGCEMKRLYVRPEGRGSRTGRALAEAAISEARRRGHARILLDTMPDMASAIALYRSLGFQPMVPHDIGALPPALFFQLQLDAW